MLLVLSGITTLLWLIGLLAQMPVGFGNFLLVLAIVLLVAHIMGRRTHTV